MDLTDVGESVQLLRRALIGQNRAGVPNFPAHKPLREISESSSTIKYLLVENNLINTILIVITTTIIMTQNHQQLTLQP